jgi:endonuclease/exonuclease/phosphatase family metal-dependent hydrolase
MNNIQMFFHPLMEIDHNHIDSQSILKRENIRVLTYNIFLRPPPVKNNENDWKDERMIDFIKQMENFDIICLQEMFGSLTSRREALIKYANRSGLFFHVDVPSPSFFSKNIIDGGLLILSRFPIVESEFRPFKYTVLSCSVVEKGILYAKIKVKDSHIAIFNVHLQATYFDVSMEQWNLCTKTRLSHVQEISEFIYHCIIDRKLTKEDRILLMGDFNIDAHGLKHKINKIDEKGNKFEFELLDEYGFLIQTLNENFFALDLIKNKFNTHPFTYGITHYTHSNIELNCLDSFETTKKENLKNFSEDLYYENKEDLPS